MKKLILMVGLPRSGKSTYALKLAKKHFAPIVSPDDVRKAIHGMDFYAPAEPLVWGVVKTMVPALFSASHDIVIVDGCHNTRKRRDEWRYLEIPLELHVMTTPASTCRARTVSDSLRAVIDRMVEQHEPPSHDEGTIRIVPGGLERE